MSAKADLKLVRSLHQKKYRDAEGLFLVQGPKLVAELLASQWPVRRIYATAEMADRMHLRDALVLPPHELERLGTLESGNAVVAVAERPPASPVAPLGTGELVLALDGIADPGNLGTVLRIADWFGVRQVLCDRGSVEAFGPKCVQASMGAIFRVTVHYVDLLVELDRLRAEGATLYLASMEGRNVFEEPLKRPAVLVLGSESHGVSAEVRGLQARTIAIPRSGGAESLNVAVAGAALCMEFTRQAGTP